MEKKKFALNEQKEMIAKSPNNIRFIAEPAEEVQMKAVTLCWQTFRLIENPSPKVRLLIP